VLLSLADDDIVYKDDMREAGLPALLVSLLGVVQGQQGQVPELRPLAALLLRCLNTLAAGDEAMQVCWKSEHDVLWGRRGVVLKNWGRGCTVL
jgi:hypothetical protein